MDPFETKGVLVSTHPPPPSAGPPSAGRPARRPLRPTAWGRKGLHKMAPEKPKRAQWVHGLVRAALHSTRRPRERKIIWGGTGVKSAKFWALHPSVPQPFKPTTLRTPNFSAHNLGDRTFSRLWLPPVGHHTVRALLRAPHPWSPQTCVPPSPPGDPPETPRRPPGDPPRRPLPGDPPPETPPETPPRRPPRSKLKVKVKRFKGEGVLKGGGGGGGS